MREVSFACRKWTEGTLLSLQSRIKVATSTARTGGVFVYLRRYRVTMVQSAESRNGLDSGSHCSTDCRWATRWCVLRQTQMGPIFVVQVDNLIPIVLNRERCVIRGIRGMGVRSGFMEHS
jgi:hypothetical protein